MLLSETDYLLLRTTGDAGADLASVPAEVRAVTLSPKPLPTPYLDPPLVSPSAIQPDPLVQQMLDRVKSTTVYSYTGDLSGEWPVDIGGSPYTIATRNHNSGTPILKATQYVGEHLAGLGLDVEHHQWDDPTNPNVIGELPGLTNPEDVFIICAHLDDMPPTGPAPGADDNASGSVGRADSS